MIVGGTPDECNTDWYYHRCHEGDEIADDYADGAGDDLDGDGEDLLYAGHGQHEAGEGWGG